MAFIYVITNDVNGKQYVGQTVNSIKYRFKEHLRNKEYFDYPLYRAMKKYGTEHFSIEQLEECPIEELNNKEIYWIKKLNTYYNGYNATLGGEGTRTRADEYSEISKTYEKTQSLEKTAKECNCSIGTIYTACQEYRVQIQSPPYGNKGKPVIGFDKNSLEIIGDFSSLHEAARSLNIGKKDSDIIRNIQRSCIQKQISAYGVIWRFKKDLPKDFKEKNPQEYLDIKKRPHYFSTVVMFDIGNRLFKKFNSIKEAALYLKNKHPEIKGTTKSVASNICSCCNKKTQTAYGYIWRFQNALPIDFENKKIEEYIKINNTKRRNRPVIMLNTNSVVLKIFHNTHKAVEYLKNNFNITTVNKSMAASINKCCNKKAHTAYGYKWEWADEYED